MHFTQLLNDSVTSCNFDLTKLYNLYGVLSNEIYGKPWSEPDVRIAAGLITEEQCLIVKLAESLDFVVTLV
jgi:hypothetical protein